MYDHSFDHPKPPPKPDALIDYNPDRNPSGNRMEFGEKDCDVLTVLEVRGEGALFLRSSTGHPDGRLCVEGVAIFTKDEIQFD